MRLRVFGGSFGLWSRGALCAMAAATVLFVIGCGGGGGGGNNGNSSSNGCVGTKVAAGSPLLATITGVVKDTANNAVDGASVIIVVPGGTNITTKTDCTGTFVATNVPLTATTFQVGSPNPVAYYNYANYNGSLYDLVACTLPLPKLYAGSNAPYSLIQMYLGGTNPPPPPPASGCPT